jgi:hypothetical protein
LPRDHWWAVLGLDLSPNACRRGNPIENAYSKIKANLRTGPARTVDALCKRVGRSVKAIAPRECAGYFRHAGYRA